MTGTRRSGTSMWMQIFDAAGFSLIGEKFPRDWNQTLRDANPRGFYESRLREGIYYATNPDPETGLYLLADESRLDVVKVFIPGLVRSERDYLDRVIASVRPWREYVDSVRRMYAIEDDLARSRGADPQPLVDVRMPPALEWWEENFALINDMAVRRYPCHVQAYSALLADPRGVLERVFAWLGPERTKGRDLSAAIAAVDPGTRTQRALEHSPADVERLGDLQLRHADIFDAYYEAVVAGQGLSALLVERMNEVQAELAGLIAHERQRTRKAAERLVAKPMPFA